MTVSACPIATVAAPLERVWAILMSPESYSTWWDATTEHIEPPGRATPGQVISASSRALGRRWPVTTTVNAIDHERHALDLTTTLPLGITVHNHILCQPLDGMSCRITFG
jgi:hypothetical protein